MKIIGIDNTHSLGNQNSEMVSLYKELIIKNKHQIYVMSNTTDCFRLIPVENLHPGPRRIVMETLHNEALAGKHI